MKIYLDYAASTPVYEEVIDVLAKSLREDYANPSSAHKLGRDAFKKIQDAKKYCLELIGVDPVNSKDHFIFPASATEANNTAVKSLNYEEGDEIFINFSDHASIVNAAKSWCACGKVKLKELPLSKGYIEIDRLIEQIEPKTKLVMIALVNNHSGHIQDVNKIARCIKEKNPNTHVHIDAVQGLFKVNWSKTDDIDSIAISGHKLGAPKGIAGLYLKDNKTYQPLLNGGGQDEGIRSSTLSTPLIMSFCKALEISKGIYEQNNERAHELQIYLRQGLHDISENFIFPFVFEKDRMSPYILTCYYKGISGDIFLRHLEQKNIFISTSSACSSKIKGEKAIYNYLEIPSTDHKFVLRLSFGPDMNKEKIDHFLKVCQEIVNDWGNLFN